MMARSIPLSSRIVFPDKLAHDDRQQLIDELYEVHDTIFAGEDKTIFAHSIMPSDASDGCMLLHAEPGGRLVGYCCLHLFLYRHDGRKVKVLRGQFGLLKDYRGSHRNVSFLFYRTLRFWLSPPWCPTYLLEAMIHPSSYLLMHHYVRTMWPAPGPRVQRGLAELVDRLKGCTGYPTVTHEPVVVVATGASTRETTHDTAYWQGCDKLAVQYFLKHNPGYREGHGLLAIAAVSLANVGHAVLRIGRVLWRRRFRLRSAATITANR